MDLVNKIIARPIHFRHWCLDHSVMDGWALKETKIRVLEFNWFKVREGWVVSRLDYYEFLVKRRYLNPCLLKICDGTRRFSRQWLRGFPPIPSIGLAGWLACRSWWFLEQRGNRKWNFEIISFFHPEGKPRHRRAPQRQKFPAS